MRLKPKQCVNRTCNKIMYVADYLLHMLLQCPDCVEERRNGRD